MIKKFGYVSEYVFWGRGVTIYPPYRNFVLQISIRGDEYRKDRDED